MDARQELLLRADLYRLLALSFSFPDEDTVNSLHTMLEGLIAGDALNPFFNEMLVVLVEECDSEAIRQDYTHIFIKGGLALTETHTLLQYNAVSDVSAFYAAFGFSAKTGETPDSIMYELEFMAILTLKMLYAQTEDQLAVCLDAYNQFLTEHLGNFALKFVEKIQEGDAGNYFITLSTLLREFIMAEMMEIPQEESVALEQ